VANLLVLPIRVAAWVLNAAAAAIIVGIVVVGWAWWTRRIPDEDVAWVMGQIGERGIAILTKAGLL
jgi:ABC-type multidrug transport system permease subunit